MKCKRCGMETFRWMGRHICFGIEREEEDEYFTEYFLPRWNVI